VFWLNHKDDLVSTQTTYLLAKAACSLGHETLLSDVHSVQSFDGTQLKFQCQVFSKDVTSLETLRPGDVHLIRTNPARDSENFYSHFVFLRIMAALESAGLRVLNSPRHLLGFLDKLYLCDVGLQRNLQTYVTGPGVRCQIQDKVQIRKPLFGTRGSGVSQVSTGVDVCGDWSIRQAFIENIEKAGDKRVWVVGGELYKTKGQLLAIHRVPKSGSICSNLHQGGTAHLVEELTQLEMNALDTCRKFLKHRGIQYAGVDISGPSILELNVFSPGGVFPFESLTKQSHSEDLLKAILFQQQP